MAHSEARSNPLREAQLALFTGGIYGATHTISGHPLDTIKTRMQIDANFRGLGTVATTRKILSDFGMIGFFRGCIPPMWGSTVYRSIMMSINEASYTYFDKNFPDDHWLKKEYACIRPMVIINSTLASLGRCVVENPVEYAKVLGQTGQQWVFKDIYRGMGWQVARTVGILVPIFSTVDYARRHSDLMESFSGAFTVTCLASGGSYLLAWPIETMKNMTQSGTPYPGATLAERIKFLGGPIGLYRGVFPGTICGGFRNGCGMVGMIYAQKLATKLGLRD